MYTFHFIYHLHILKIVLYIHTHKDNFCIICCSKKEHAVNYNADSKR